MAVRGQEMDESHIDSYAAHDVAPSAGQSLSFLVESLGGEEN